MRVRVDESLCQGHTLCAFSAPEVFHLREEDGHAYVAVEEVPADQEHAVLQAIDGCPERAIVLVE